jgi:hypothetical protein
MSRGWQHADFSTRVGAEVTLRALDGPGAGTAIPATLTACSGAVRRGGLVSYNVTFLAGLGAPRRQAVFLVEGAGLDADPVFLVPRREVGNEGLEYEAVFNQSDDDGSGS